MLREFSRYVVYSLLKPDNGTRLADALEFFIFDTIKIFFLLSVIIFIVSVVRSFFPPERTQRILSHKREFIGNIFAALLGVVTPFLRTVLFMPGQTPSRYCITSGSTSSLPSVSAGSSTDTRLTISSQNTPGTAIPLPCRLRSRLASRSIPMRQGSSPLSTL